MTRQSATISRRRSSTAGKSGAPKRHPDLGKALAGTLHGNDAALAIACLVDASVDPAAPGVRNTSAIVSALTCPLAQQRDRSRHANLVDSLRCRVTWRLVAELFAAACERDLPEGAARRRPRCHMRQIAMYLSHVVLSVPYQSIAIAFGRDRTTVVHACSVVEDRRDEPAYDRFVEQCERCIKAVFAPLEHDNAEL